MGILYRDCYIPCYSSIQLEFGEGRGAVGLKLPCFCQSFLFLDFQKILTEFYITTVSLYMYFYVGSTEGVGKTQCPCHIRWHLDAF